MELYSAVNYELEHSNSQVNRGKFTEGGRRVSVRGRYPEEMKFTSLNHDTVYNNNSAYNDGDGGLAQSKARRSRRSPRGKGKTLHGDGKPVADSEVPVARPDSYYDGEGRTRNLSLIHI